MLFESILMRSPWRLPGSAASAPELDFSNDSGHADRDNRSPMMLDHVDFAVVNVAASRQFYEAALAPLGIHIVIVFDQEPGRQGVGFGRDGMGAFFIGAGSPVAGRLHVAFQASSRAAVDAFHQAALLAGGRNHGDPGLRPHYGTPYYAAFVRDPDGHVIEAVCRLNDSH